MGNYHLFIFHTIPKHDRTSSISSAFSSSTSLSLFAAHFTYIQQQHLDFPEVSSWISHMCFQWVLLTYQHVHYLFLSLLSCLTIHVSSNFLFSREVVYMQTSDCSASDYLTYHPSALALSFWACIFYFRWKLVLGANLCKLKWSPYWCQSRSAPESSRVGSSWDARVEQQ